MKSKMSLSKQTLRGRRVLMRVDFNVPLDSSGKITDISRIKASLPSIKYVIENGGKLVLMSHLGRPIGKDSKLSLKPCGAILEKLLGKNIDWVDDCMGLAAKKKAKELKEGEILLLENLRFYEAEEHPEKDPAFAKQLAELGDLYCNDAFGTSHRAHSSIVPITEYFPNKAVAGFLLEKEIKYLGVFFEKPKHPFAAIIGGAKISTKLGVLKALLIKVDSLLIGGAMAYTFLKLQGIKIGHSLYEESQLKEAKDLIDFCNKQKVKLILPVDHVIENLQSGEIALVTNEQGIPSGFRGVDIGKETLLLFKESLQKAELIFWNGPLGVFENPLFEKGTLEIAKVLATSKASTIVGGGDSVAAIEKMGLTECMTHISTGGGAALEYIEFGKLPGVDALSEDSA